MKKNSYPVYDLTPMGNDWGLSQRLAEIAFQTVGFIVFRPILVILNWIFFDAFPRKAVVTKSSRLH
jgi:hypothetical protein